MYAYFLFHRFIMSHGSIFLSDVFAERMSVIYIIIAFLIQHFGRW